MCTIYNNFVHENLDETNKIVTYDLTGQWLDLFSYRRNYRFMIYAFITSYGILHNT